MNDHLPQRIATAVAFYSRLPVPAALVGGSLKDAVAMAPIAGVAVALPAALVLLLADLFGASPLVAAVLAALTLIVVTGALHEDGLADCADGFWGGAEPDARLAIMRDSRVGTYGVLALVGAVLLKVAVLQSAIAAAGAGYAALMLMAAAAAARAVALYPWVGLGPARRDGLDASIGRPGAGAFRHAVLIALVVTALLVAWWAPLGFLLAALVAAATARGCASLAERKIGGHTGDVIGATVIAADMTYLLALTIWTL